MLHLCFWIRFYVTNSNIHFHIFFLQRKGTFWYLHSLLRFFEMLKILLLSQSSDGKAEMIFTVLVYLVVALSAYSERSTNKNMIWQRLLPQMRHMLIITTTAIPIIRTYVRARQTG